MEAKNDIGQNPNQGSKKTLRLTFSYVGEKVKLENVKEVNMLTPAPAPFKIDKGQSGFWFEIQDENKKILYQKAMNNPIKFYVEVHDEEMKEQSTMHKVESPKGVFEILTPDFENGYSIVLFSSPFEEENIFKPAKELARFNLKSNPKN